MGSSSPTISGSLLVIGITVIGITVIGITVIGITVIMSLVLILPGWSRARRVRDIVKASWL